MRTKARFPGIPLRAGHYESFYIKATRPDGGLGVWIRHTVHKRPRAEPTASLWFTLFDAEAPSPVAAKNRLKRSAPKRFASGEPKAASHTMLTAR